MTTTHTLPIVGAHFRPPAKALLQVMHGATPLTLVREPDNAYDPNAVQVMLNGSDLSALTDDDLADAIIGTGWTPDEVRSGVLHLGYVPRTEAEWLSPKITGGDLPAALSFTVEGKPAVRFTLEEGA